MLILLPLPTSLLVLLHFGFQLLIFKFELGILARKLLHELLVVQVLELDGVDDLVQKLGWVGQVVLYAPQLFLVSYVERIRLLLAAGDAQVWAARLRFYATSELPF